MELTGLGRGAMSPVTFPLGDPVRHADDGAAARLKPERPGPTGPSNITTRATCPSRGPGNGQRGPVVGSLPDV